MEDSETSSESSVTSYSKKDTRVTFLVDNEELLGPQKKNKKKKPRTKVSKSLSCCFQTAKYTFLCCKCLINYRCLILFLFCLMALLIFCLNNWKQLLRMKRVWDAWGDDDEVEVKKNGGWFDFLG